MANLSYLFAGVALLLLGVVAWVLQNVLEQVENNTQQIEELRRLSQVLTDTIRAMTRERG